MVIGGAMHTDSRRSIGDIPRKALPATLASSIAERRNASARAALVHRIRHEFDEMPGTALTLPQATRLFGVAPEVCDRVLLGLVNDGQLRRTQDGRFRRRS